MIINQNNSHELKWSVGVTKDDSLYWIYGPDKKLPIEDMKPIDNVLCITEIFPPENIILSTRYFVNRFESMGSTLSRMLSEINKSETIFHPLDIA